MVAPAPLFIDEDVDNRRDALTLGAVKPVVAASCVEECEMGLRVDGFRAAGRAAIQASTSSSFHARAFGVIKAPKVLEVD